MEDDANARALTAQVPQQAQWAFCRHSAVPLNAETRSILRDGIPGVRVRALTPRACCVAGGSIGVGLGCVGVVAASPAGGVVLWPNVGRRTGWEQTPTLVQVVPWRQVGKWHRHVGCSECELWVKVRRQQGEGLLVRGGGGGGGHIQSNWMQKARACACVRASTPARALSFAVCASRSRGPPSQGRPKATHADESESLCRVCVAYAGTMLGGFWCGWPSSSCVGGRPLSRLSRCGEGRTTSSGVMTPRNRPLSFIAQKRSSFWIRTACVLVWVKGTQGALPLARPPSLPLLRAHRPSAR